MASLEERVARLEAASAAASGSTAQIGELLNLMWFLLTACMIFVMQCGFCMLEAGSIRKKNVKNMLMKNLMDVCVACIAWLLIGHGLASDGSGGFIGEMGLLSSNATMSQLAAWTQELMYATTSVTIVSGALAERAHLGSYALSSFVTAALSYPAVAHWVWADLGWLSVSNPNAFYGGAIDFAGGGAVHLTGGITALVGASVIGARMGRFNAVTGDPVPIAGHSSALLVFGTFHLFAGWLAFNMGSVALHGEKGNAVAAARAVSSTMIAGCSGGLTTAILVWIKTKRWDVKASCNGVLSGLVSVTAGCGVVQQWAAAVIGVIGGLLYLGSSFLILHKLKVDDAVEASAVHGVCGVWSLLAAGLFACGKHCGQSSRPAGAFYGNPQALVASLVAVISIVAWSSSIAAISFAALKRLRMLRVDEEAELAGIDITFGGTEKDPHCAPSVMRRPPPYTNPVVVAAPPFDEPAANGPEANDPAPSGMMSLP